MNLKKQITGLMMALLMLAPSVSSAMTLEEMKDTLVSISSLLDNMTDSMSAQVIKSRTADVTAELTKPDQTHPDAGVNYDVNRDGQIDINDLRETEDIIRNYIESRQYNAFGDLDQDNQNDNDDFFILRNYLAESDEEVAYYVDWDQDVDLGDLSDIEGHVSQYQEQPEDDLYRLFSDLNQNDVLDNEDYFILRNYLAETDEEILYYVDFDQDVDIADLRELEDHVWDYQEQDEYRMSSDLNQNDEVDNDDFFILRNYLAESDEEVAYYVDWDQDVDLGDLSDIEGHVSQYQEQPEDDLYRLFSDLNQNDVLDNEDYFILRNYLAETDEEILYYVDFDQDVDIADLRELEDHVWDYQEQDEYRMSSDLNQNDEVDNDDFFILRNYLAESDEEVAYYVDWDQDVDLGDLNDLEDHVIEYQEESFYRLFSDLNQNEALDKGDYNILAVYLGVSSTTPGYESSELLDVVSVEKNSQSETDMANFGQTTDRAELERQLQMLIVLLNQLLAEQLR